MQNWGFVRCFFLLRWKAIWKIQYSGYETTFNICKCNSSKFNRILPFSFDFFSSFFLFLVQILLLRRCKSVLSWNIFFLKKKQKKTCYIYFPLHTQSFLPFSTLYERDFWNHFIKFTWNAWALKVKLYNCLQSLFSWPRFSRFNYRLAWTSSHHQAAFKLAWEMKWTKNASLLREAKQKTNRKTT